MEQAPTSSPEAEPPDDPPQARRSGRRWLWFGGALVVLPVVGVLVFNAWAAAKLDRALEDLRARGEPTTVAELYALLEANAPDDEHNLAKVPALLALQNSDAGRSARAMLEAERPHHLDLLKKSDPGWGSASRSIAGSGTATVEDFDQWHPDNLPASGPSLESSWEWIEHPAGAAASIYQMSAFLHESIHELAAEARHRSRAFWTWPEPNEGERPDLSANLYGPDSDATLATSTTLRIIALAALERGDAELALAAVEFKLALMRTHGEGSALSGGMAASAILKDADGPMYVGLLRQAWDEEQLRRLLSGLDLTVPALDLQAYLRATLIFDLLTIVELKEDPSLLAVHSPFARWSRFQEWFVHTAPGGSFDLAAVRLIRNHESGFLQPGAPLPPEAPLFERPLPSGMEWLRQVQIADLVNLPAWVYHLVAVRLRASETRLHLARAAAALELFHLRHGRYPGTWQEMIPGEIAGVPLDPFTGGELRLLPVEEAAGRFRPVIYSLGLNRTDDGGTQVYDDNDPDYLSDTHATGDVVWAYPKEEAEDVGGLDE